MSCRLRRAGRGGGAALLLSIAVLLAVVVLLAGIIGQITHTGLFFVPALAAMAVAALRLWRERG